METKYLYIGCNGNIAAIDAVSGEIVWQKSLKAGFFGDKVRENVTVLVDNEIVIAGCHGHVFGFDSMTGEQLWSNNLEGYGHNDVSLAMSEKSIQVVKKVKHQ